VAFQKDDCNGCQGQQCDDDYPDSLHAHNELTKHFRPAMTDLQACHNFANLILGRALSVSDMGYSCREAYLQVNWAGLRFVFSSCDFVDRSSYPEKQYDPPSQTNQPNRIGPDMTISNFSILRREVDQIKLLFAFTLPKGNTYCDQANSFRGRDRLRTIHGEVEPACRRKVY
jgi:hypothetical protein